MTDRPAHWPKGVNPIGIEAFSRLGLNEDNELFWGGKRIEVRQALVLTGLQKFFAIIVSICAILGGLGGFASGIGNTSLFLCARNIEWLSCPAPTASPAPMVAPAPAASSPAPPAALPVPAPPPPARPAGSP